MNRQTTKTRGYLEALCDVFSRRSLLSVHLRLRISFINVKVLVNLHYYAWRTLKITIPRKLSAIRVGVSAHPVVGSVRRETHPCHRRIEYLQPASLGQKIASLVDVPDDRGGQQETQNGHNNVHNHRIYLSLFLSLSLFTAVFYYSSQAQKNCRYAAPSMQLCDRGGGGGDGGL